MSQSKTLKTAAALTSLGLAVAGLIVAPIAMAAERGADPVASRIEMGFAAAAQLQVDAGTLDALTKASVAPLAAKGDLPASVGCATQTWPNIASGCLVTADGSSVHAVRFVTVGYRSGAASSVVMRMPSQQIASN